MKFQNSSISFDTSTKFKFLLCYDRVQRWAHVALAGLCCLESVCLWWFGFN